MLATQNGTRKFTATRIHVPASPSPCVMTAPWLTNDRTIPTNSAVGPAVRTVDPRRNIATASRGRLHVRPADTATSAETVDDRCGDPAGFVFLHEVVGSW